MFIIGFIIIYYNVYNASKQYLLDLLMFNIVRFKDSPA